MSLFRTLLIVGISGTFLACSNGEEDKYRGPAPLSDKQSLEAEQKVSELGRLVRAMEIVEDGESADKDIEDFLELITPCDTKAEDGEGKDGTQWRRFKIYDKNKNGDCPIKYNTVFELKILPDGERIRSTAKYTTTNINAVAALGIRSASAEYTESPTEFPKVSITVDFASLENPVSIIDTENWQFFEPNVLVLTHFRRMSINGFSVEARIILQYEIISEDEAKLTDLKMIINGKNVDAEEMYRIFPKDVLTNSEKNALKRYRQLRKGPGPVQ